MIYSGYDIEAIVTRRITEFNRKRLKKIQEIDIHSLLKKKNPYLFIAQQIETPEALAEILDKVTQT